MYFHTQVKRVRNIVVYIYIHSQSIKQSINQAIKQSSNQAIKQSMHTVLLYRGFKKEQFVVDDINDVFEKNGLSLDDFAFRFYDDRVNICKNKTYFICRINDLAIKSVQIANKYVEMELPKDMTVNEFYTYIGFTESNTMCRRVYGAESDTSIQHTVLLFGDDVL